MCRDNDCCCVRIVCAVGPLPAAAAGGGCFTGASGDEQRALPAFRRYWRLRGVDHGWGGGYRNRARGWNVMIPVMLQRWHEISFFHWSCDPGLLQPRLPEGLQI